MHNSYCNERFISNTENNGIFDFLMHNNVSRVLEIGCGDGQLLHRLCNMFPHIQFVGIDISEENIVLAKQNTLSNIEFHCGDYLKFNKPPYDLILSHSVLHLLPIDNDPLFSKISMDLFPNGRCAMVIPYQSFYNSCLYIIRKILYTLKGKFTDWLIFNAARLVFKHYSDNFIRDRINYMYRQPYRIYNQSFNHYLINTHGFIFDNMTPISSTPFGKAQHALICYRKHAS